MLRNGDVRPTQFRPFRVGVRRKPSPAAAASSTRSPEAATSTRRSTSSPPSATQPTRSRPTKIIRRKYLAQAARPVESQEVTTPKPKVNTVFRFVARTRTPFRRTTTPKASVEETTATAATAATAEEAVSDQALESSNQQSLEEDFEGGKTTELADIAAALQDIQVAPLPGAGSHRTSGVPLTSTPRATSAAFVSQATRRVVLNKATERVTQAAQRITSRKPTKSSRVRYSTTASPLLLLTTASPQKTRPHKAQPFEKSPDYAYYDDAGGALARIPAHSKVLLHADGTIECLDQGNFPHPVSCRKFISCARMENGRALGWEYTCPKNLSFDPIGGMCNWSAGLGCGE